MQDSPAPVDPTPSPSSSSSGGGDPHRGNTLPSPVPSPAVNSSDIADVAAAVLNISDQPSPSPAAASPESPAPEQQQQVPAVAGNATADDVSGSNATAGDVSGSNKTAVAQGDDGSTNTTAGGINASSNWTDGNTGASNAPANVTDGSNAAGASSNDSNATTVGPAGGNATTAGNTTDGSKETTAPNGSNSSAVSGFPGYPHSGGLLYPQLDPLLLAIQEARLYKDSKTAVDLVLKSSVADTSAAWQQLLTSKSQNTTDAQAGNSSSSNSSIISPEALRGFVNRTKDDAGSDLVTCTAVDWTAQPAGFLANLAVNSSSGSTGDASAGAGAAGGVANATELRQFGLQLHQLWGLLCRQVSPSVSANPERHSLLPLPYATIVPGDRFRETYYWDSYWVIRGLLVSGMTQSATNLVSNLMSMLEAVGHVPNGARVYYLNRSQPPLLSAMVRDVYQALHDKSLTDNAPDTNGGNSSSSSSAGKGTELLTKALPLLLREHEYWTTGPKGLQIQGPDGSMHNLSRYYANWTAPRPESYREDAELARNVTGTDSPDNPAAAVLYRELASGAESGWDYSSRWFADMATMETIRTTQIIPADLNAFLYQLEVNIAWAASELGDTATQQRFEATARDRRNSMTRLLWDNEAGMWRDGILQPRSNATTDSNSNSSSSNASAVYTLTQNPGIFASNFIPLWAGLADGDVLTGSRAVDSLNKSGLVQPAGIATTLYQTGQQWDWPNGWPPLQHMLVEGARKFGGNPGQEFACSLARTWLDVNMHVYNTTGAMHEKYDVTTPAGRIGGGGEYAPQVGFGWSNGVALDFLANYC